MGVEELEECGLPCPGAGRLLGVYGARRRCRKGLAGCSNRAPGFWDPALRLAGAVTQGQAWPCSALLPSSLWKAFPVLCSSDQALFLPAAPTTHPPQALQLLSFPSSCQSSASNASSSPAEPPWAGESLPYSRTLMGWLGRSPAPPPAAFGFSSPAVVQRPKMLISAF